MLSEPARQNQQLFYLVLVSFWAAKERLAKKVFSPQIRVSTLFPGRFRMEKRTEDSYEAILEEIEALQSIFCNPEEFVLISSPDFESSCDPVSFKINLKCNYDDPEEGKGGATKSSTCGFSVEMNVILPPHYPVALPRISLSCTEITKGNLQVLRGELSEYAGSLSEGPKIMELAMWIQQQAYRYRSIPSFSTSVEGKVDQPREENNTSRSLVLLVLDHMRNRTRYVKFLSSWAQELDIKGFLFFTGHLILLLLEGEHGDVKEYLRRHKSCNVDVDSSGKPCKEKMMTVLTLEESPASLE